MLLTSELAPKSLFWIFFRSAAEMRSNQHTIFALFCVRVGPKANSINCEKKENSTDAFWNGARSTNWPTTSVAHRCGDGRPHLLTHTQTSTSAWLAAAPRRIAPSRRRWPRARPSRRAWSGGSAPSLATDVELLELLDGRCSSSAPSCRAAARVP